MDIGLSEQTRMKISDALFYVLADTYALYLNTQNFHWNIKGTEFYSLHLLFEKHYEELAAATDEIAERIRALGYYVDASFEAFQKRSDVKGESKLLNIKEMLQKLIEGHETLIRRARKVAETADQEGDFATVDMLGRRLGAHEKMAWFLRSQF